MTGKILIVDDDIHIQNLLSKIVTYDGYTPITASNGNEALKQAKNNDFSLILLDVTMAGIDGFQVTKSIRKLGIQTPIMIISGRNEDYDALYGLEIGADDYITKPFNPVVLGGKIKALIRRNNQITSNECSEIHIGKYYINNNNIKFYKYNEEILLSSKEFKIMQLFMSHPNQVFTKEMLYKQVWNNDFVDENAIMVYISRLRNKLEDNPKKPEFIQTVWGIGYKIPME